jgi:hypothetical protein
MRLRLTALPALLAFTACAGPPPPGETAWVPGRWMQQPAGGWIWVEGHWT